jgi:DNA-binding transcriptional LysR family regulator
VAVAANDPLVVREAVLAGLGLGVLSAFDAEGRDRLRAIFPDNEDWAVPLWLVTHVDLHRTEKVQEMLAHIKALQRDAHAITG